MGLSLVVENRCRKDIKKVQKRGKDLEKLFAIVDILTQGKSLPAKNREHKLSGDWQDFWECHIEPDWLLIYYKTQNELILVRTGSHSDLFG